LDDLLADPELLLVSEKLLERREVQNALPKEIVSKLLSSHTALEVNQLPILPE
jgi:hypothetical protein